MNNLRRPKIFAGYCTDKYNLNMEDGRHEMEDMEDMSISTIVDAVLPATFMQKEKCSQQIYDNIKVKVRKKAEEEMKKSKSQFEVMLSLRFSVQAFLQSELVLAEMDKKGTSTFTKTKLKLNYDENEAEEAISQDEDFTEKLKKTKVEKKKDSHNQYYNYLSEYKLDEDLYEQVKAVEMRGKNFKSSNDGACPKCKYRSNVFVILDFLFIANDMPEMLQYLLTQGKAVLWSSKESLNCKDPPTFLCGGRCPGDIMKCGFNINWATTDLEKIYLFPETNFIEKPRSKADVNVIKIQDEEKTEETIPESSVEDNDVLEPSTHEEDGGLKEDGGIDEDDTEDEYDEGHVDIDFYRNKVSWVVLDEVIEHEEDRLDEEAGIIRTMLALEEARTDYICGAMKTKPLIHEVIEIQDDETATTQIDRVLSDIDVTTSTSIDILSSSTSKSSLNSTEVIDVDQTISDTPLQEATYDGGKAKATKLQDATYNGGKAKASKPAFTKVDFPVSTNGICPYCKSTDVVYIIIDDGNLEEELPSLLHKLQDQGYAKKMPKGAYDLPSFQCNGCTYGFNLDWTKTNLEEIFKEKSKKKTDVTTTKSEIATTVSTNDSPTPSVTDLTVDDTPSVAASLQSVATTINTSTVNTAQYPTTVNTTMAQYPNAAAYQPAMNYYYTPQTPYMHGGYGMPPWGHHMPYNGMVMPPMGMGMPPPFGAPYQPFYYNHYYPPNRMANPSYYGWNAPAPPPPSNYTPVSSSTASTAESKVPTSDVIMIDDDEEKQPATENDTTSQINTEETKANGEESIDSEKSANNNDIEVSTGDNSTSDQTSNVVSVESTTYTVIDTLAETDEETALDVIDLSGEDQSVTGSANKRPDVLLTQQMYLSCDDSQSDCSTVEITGTRESNTPSIQITATKEGDLLSESSSVEITGSNEKVDFRSELAKETLNIDLTVNETEKVSEDISKTEVENVMKDSTQYSLEVVSKNVAKDASNDVLKDAAEIVSEDAELPEGEQFTEITSIKVIDENVSHTHENKNSNHNNDMDLESHYSNESKPLNVLQTGTAGNSVEKFNETTEHVVDNVSIDISRSSNEYDEPSTSSLEENIDQTKNEKEDKNENVLSLKRGLDENTTGEPANKKLLIEYNNTTTLNDAATVTLATPLNTAGFLSEDDSNTSRILPLDLTIVTASNMVTSSKIDISSMVDDTELMLDSATFKDKPNDWVNENESVIGINSPFTDSLINIVGDAVNSDVLKYKEDSNPLTGLLTSNEISSNGIVLKDEQVIDNTVQELISPRSENELTSPEEEEETLKLESSEKLEDSETLEAAAVEPVKVSKPTRGRGKGKRGRGRGRGRKKK